MLLLDSLVIFFLLGSLNEVLKLDVLGFGLDGASAKRTLSELPLVFQAGLAKRVAAGEENERRVLWRNHELEANRASVV